MFLRLKEQFFFVSAGGGGGFCSSNFGGIDLFYTDIIHLHNLLFYVPMMIASLYIKT